MPLFWELVLLFWLCAVLVGFAALGPIAGVVLFYVACTAVGFL